MDYGSRAVFDRVLLTIVTVVVLTVIGIILLCLLYAIIRFYVFGKLLAKEKSARAVVTRKRYQIIATPRGDDANEDRDMMIGGYLAGLYWLISSLPLVGLIRNGLDEPYQVSFDLADGKKVELYVTDSVYMQLLEGQEGILTYKGKHLVRFKSNPL